MAHSFNICLIGMSAKPFHAGHSLLVAKAAAECDIVQIYTSFNIRGTAPDEHLISSAASKKMWEHCVLPSLSKNVEVTFVSNPISAIYSELQDPMDDAAYHIYGGEEDIQKSFGEVKKWTNLVLGTNLILHPIDRLSLHRASGTEVRRALFKRDFKLFESLMPNNIDKSQAWQILLNN